MTRREFTAGTLALAAAGFAKGAETTDRAAFQREIDAVTPKDYGSFRDAGPDLAAAERDAVFARLPALRRYDAAFDRVYAEALGTTIPAGGRPAVWHVYNMGFIVRTPQALFSIDLCHRQGPRLAPHLDFALITHNHGDHFTQPFYRAMDGGEHKTVINNFADNYGAYFARKHPGGFTRGPKAFTIKDVTIKASVSDHNGYLIDYTMPFEIAVNGFRIFHTGDSQNIAKLNPAPSPDLWIVHPYCGLKVSDGVRKFAPKLTVIGHLNELGHARDRWRWTWNDGERARQEAEKAGGRALVPLWGDRIDAGC